VTTLAAGRGGGRHVCLGLTSLILLLLDLRAPGHLRLLGGFSLGGWQPVLVSLPYR
jgi:hypothetical protein